MNKTSQKHTGRQRSIDPYEQWLGERIVDMHRLRKRHENPMTKTAAGVYQGCLLAYREIRRQTWAKLDKARAKQAQSGQSKQ